MPSQPLATHRPEIPALTSLRFFAAFWVLLFHIREIGLWLGGTAAYIAFVKLGYLGVSFFFVLSGFILVYVYAGREVPKTRFWQARFARVYPVYFLALLVTVPNIFSMLPLLHITSGTPKIAVPAFVLLVEAWLPRELFFWNPVAWSLSVEAFFYLVFPFAMRLMERRGDWFLRVSMAGLWLASLAMTFSYMLLKPDGVAWPTSRDNFLIGLAVIKFNPIVRLPEFLLGMCVSLLFLRHRPRPASWPIAAGALLIVAGMIFQDWIPYPVMHSGLLAPAFALIIYGFASRPAWTGVFGARPLILLGEASYSLYLLHASAIAVMVMVFHLDRSPHIALVIGVYVVLMLLVSIGIYMGIENPLRKLLRPRQLPQPVPAVA